MQDHLSHKDIFTSVINNNKYIYIYDYNINNVINSLNNIIALYIINFLNFFITNTKMHRYPRFVNFRNLIETRLQIIFYNYT